MRPRVVVAHEPFGPAGGGELVGAWFLQALARDHALTLVCARPFDWRAVDARFGTDLADRNIGVETWPRPWRGLVALWPTVAERLRVALQERGVRDLARRQPAALWVSTCNELRLPRPGLHYVHFPTLGARPPPRAELRDIQRLPGGARVYDGLCRAVAPPAGAGLGTLQENATWVNSRFTAAAWRRLSAAPARVVYPPVPPLCAEELPWAERRDQVVCLGRLLPGKGLERVIRIVDTVRAAGWPLTLVFAGSWDCAPGERRRLERVLAAQAWVEVRVRPSRAEVAALVGASRYGLHGMEREPFGIAVAELQDSGVLTFAPAEGGPAEILEDERLLYHDEADAAARLIRVRQDPALQAELRAGAAARRGRFSAERFVSTVRSGVAELLAER